MPERGCKRLTVYLLLPQLSSVILFGASMLTNRARGSVFAPRAVISNQITGLMVLMLFLLFNCIHCATAQTRRGNKHFGFSAP